MNLCSFVALPYRGEKLKAIMYEKLQGSKYQNKKSAWKFNARCEMCEMTLFHSISYTHVNERTYQKKHTFRRRLALRISMQPVT